MKQSETKPFKRIVVKYGGASLADDERMLRAVTAIASKAMSGTQIVVVVSALGKTTDFLMQVAKSVSNGKVAKEDMDDILSIGERTSIRLFAAALKARGVESRYFDPLDLDWPIITDVTFSNANPIREECEKRTQQYVLPLLERGAVPIIAGFVGRTADGRITTIGRGGSDTTAFILAKALKAEKVILVADIDGIMTADPKLVSNPRRVQKINVDALVGLTDSGTKFMHRKALKYKDAEIDVKVVNYALGDLDAEGTIITGALPTELDVDIVDETPVIMITVVGNNIWEQPAIAMELIEKVKAHTELIGLSGNHNSIIMYLLEGKEASSLLNGVHETVLKYEQAISVAVKKQLAFVRIKGIGLEETPGILGTVSETLRRSGINVFGLLTITSSILLFVEWTEKESALNLIKSSLRGK